MRENLHHGDSSADGTETIVRLETALGAMRARWEAIEQTREAGKSSRLLQDGILKCYNVQYAEIPYRWAAPRKISLPWSGTRDCTEFGPGCPQIGSPLFDAAGVPMFGRLGKDASGHDAMAIRPQLEDEFACLNLNIYAPAGMDAAGTKETVFPFAHLPVLVWVHGGSYQVGSGGVDAYDGTNLVRRGLVIGAPAIVITMNYRLGILGFLHSEELAADAAMQLDVAPAFRSTANLALIDAKYAFDWIKENISHFGGDRENITAIGESAGAGIIHHLSLVPQLHIRIPRAILSSSTCMSIQLLRPAEAQSSFDAICRRFGIVSSESAVEQLRSITVGELVEKTWFINSTFRPVFDGVTITTDPRHAVFEPDLWDRALESIILGTCQNEFVPIRQPWIREVATVTGNKKHDIRRIIDGRIPDQGLRQRAALLYADPQAFMEYKTHEDLNVPAQHRCSMALEGHGRYYTPAALFSRSFVSGRGTTQRRILYRYVFGYSTAHWPKSWPVTHTADILPMFLHRSLNARDRRVAEAFADRLLVFATSKDIHGEEAKKELAPWLPYTASERRLNVLGSDGGWSIVDESTAGIFDLTEEYVQFWEDVLKAVLATGRNGWPEMTR